MTLLQLLLLNENATRSAGFGAALQTIATDFHCPSLGGLLALMTGLVPAIRPSAKQCLMYAVLVAKQLRGTATQLLEAEVLETAYMYAFCSVVPLFLH